jgi:type I restriction enzyme, S subunit
MSEWQECKLGVVADRIGMGPFGSNIKISTFVSDGIPVISGTHLRGIRLEDKEYNFITVVHANKLQSANVYRGDVIFTHAGNIGQVAFIPNNSKYERYIISQRQFYLRSRMDKLIPEYLTYYFKSREGQYKLLANANQTGVPSLAQPVSYLKSIDILLPPLPEQRAIADVLSSLDDKIDLLHRQNKTLEGMAEALWRKMFVEEADPGWKRGRLCDIAEINPLRSIKKGAIATYLDMSNMPTNSPFPKKWVQREFSSGMKFKNGDTVMARITPCLENGKTAYVNFLNHEEIAWGSTEYIVLAPKPGYSSEWYYFLARNDDFRDFAIQNMTGTSGRQRVSGDSIAQYEIAIPPINIFERFRKFAGPLMEHIKHNSFQIRTLSRLRDTLLPKLMSGEVRVGSKEGLL